MAKVRIGIVVSEFNNEITFDMLDEARNYIDNEHNNVKLLYTCKVPGVFDMPLMVEELLKKKNIDAVVTLGAVIKGETSHDKVITNATVNLISVLSIKHQKPVALGITGPDMTFEQAEARITPVTHHAINTAILMTKRLKKLHHKKQKKKEHHLKNKSSR
jgi:6,7-dimethyl-8-ribityllumazine synthase